MKALLTTLLLLPILATATTHRWAANGAGELVNLNVSATVQPGDTIIISSPQYKLIRLEGITGTRLNPIIITIDGTDTVRTGINAATYGILLTGTHFKLLGKNKLVSENPNGLLANNIIFGSSSEFTIDGVICRTSKAALLGNPKTGGVRKNLRFTNLYIENMNTGQGVGLGTCEAIYLGSTALKQIGEHQIVTNGVTETVNASYDSVLFENIVMKDLDGDGIQVAMAQNVIMRNCTITNWGRKNISSHRNAYLVGGSSQATIENCTATTGTGPYVQVFGHNKTVIKDCNFSGGATGSASEDGIFIDKKNLDAPGLQVEIKNTVINGARRNAIRNLDATSVTLCNVTMSNATAGNTSGPNISVVNCDAAPDPPQPIKPTVKPTTKPKIIKTGRVIKIRG